MTDLERRALLGDRKAQEECTRQGIVLACPLCGESATVSKAGHLFHCYRCSSTLTFPARFSKIWALKRWNTRPVTPVGCCGERAKEVKCDNCANKDDPNRCLLTGQQKPITCLCSGYEPKESEENATD